ncbi:MAG TPA: T9SS type A sorting domain-containing protein [Bacteroidota bacterium]|nr:T9SS type A sorting domain-containing protein [Bacteroidota bacterium]
MRNLSRLLVLGLLMLQAVSLRAQHQHSHADDQGVAVRLPEEVLTMTRAQMQERQTLAKAHLALRGFAEKNADWNFYYDALRRTPHRAWGSGIAIDGYSSINLLNAPRAGAQFIERHADVLNVEPSALRMLYSEIVDGKAYQKYIQTYRGLDVLHSYVDLRIAPNGKVVMFGSDFHKNIDVETTPTVALDAAREFAKAGLPYTSSNDHITDRGIYILPMRYNDHIDYRLVYQFEVQNGPRELWETYVDAHTGAIVWRHDLIPHFHNNPNGGPNAMANVVNGTIRISIYPTSYVAAPVTVPLKNAYVWIAGKMYVTDADGKFTADLGSATTGQLITRLSGPYARVRRDDTTRVSGGTPVNAVQSMTVAAGQTLELLWDDANSVSSERNTFYHINLVRDFSRAIDPGPANAQLDSQIPGLVEINDECNAFFDGRGVNFFRSSVSCGNTGEIASVIHHEIGHGIHIWLHNNLLGRGPVNGALKEALADMTSNFLSDDPRIGVGFLKGGANGGIIRNSKNTLRYPENVVNEIHDDGMILTGAVWDVREAIGLEHTKKLYHMAMYGTPDAAELGIALADYFVEFLVADDDDGDLSNGTPNSPAIIKAFNDHGIPGSAIRIAHAGMQDQNSVTQPYVLTGTARVPNEINPDLMSIQRVDAVYSIDNWATQERVTATYNPGTRAFSAEIPPQRAGTIVRYYFEATDNFGSSATEPGNAPSSSYLFLVGFERKEFHNAEEIDGYAVKGDATTGQWVREVPIGTWNTQLGSPPNVPFVQPDEDFTPGSGNTRCWVTGNATRGSQLGANDVDDGETILTSRNYDISALSTPVLRYYRWYSNNAGAEPGQDFWTVRISEGGSNWAILERTRQTDASWQPRVFVIKDFITPSATMKVEFTAADDEPGSLVEAAVDDIEILDINLALVDVDNTPVRPVDLRLEQNFPNPFNPSTTIRYTLPEASQVEVHVFNALGVRVALLREGLKLAGTHEAQFDAGALPSGVYMYEMRAAGQRLSRTMTLSK